MSEAALLDRGLAELKLDLSPDARKKLLDFAALLGKWNRVYNLTAIRSPEQAITHHLLDSLVVLPPLAGIARLADIGSGGGLPGIPLAIARPELQITSIETVGKKSSFQQQAKIELRLPNFTPIHARVEDVVPDAPFDAVISRAFSDIADFVQLTRHLLGSGGRFLAMKGVYPQDELASLPAGVRLVEALPLTVPGLDAERHLIILERD
jgi:16S rRNA (guanine527-N7)-methyltransferase